MIDDRFIDYRTVCLIVHVIGWSPAAYLGMQAESHKNLASSSFGGL